MVWGSSNYHQQHPEDDWYLNGARLIHLDYVGGLLNAFNIVSKYDYKYIFSEVSLNFILRLVH